MNKPMQSLQSFDYLESIDSVRDPVVPDEDMSRINSHIQVVTEMIASLALGHDIVVPQPYAVDSVNFLRGAAAVLAARDDVWDPLTAMDRPFKLHLYSAGSFRDAFAAMVTGAGGASDKAFYSSLAPELAEHSDVRGMADQLRDGNPQPFYKMLGDERRDLLKPVWKEFGAAELGDAALVVTASPVGVVTLPMCVQALVQLDPKTTPGLADLVGNADYEVLRETLNRMLTAFGSAPNAGHKGKVEVAFSSRSEIYVSKPWPGLGGPASEVLTPDQYAMVKEFIDTAYNLVIAHSIGLAPVACSTPVLSGGSAVAADLNVAQRCAISAYRACRPRRTSVGDRSLDADADADADADSEPTLQIGIRPGRKGLGDALVVDRLDAGSVGESLRKSLRQIFEARASRTFRESVEALEIAQMSGNVSNIERSLERHAKLVGKHLSGSPMSIDCHGLVVAFSAGALIGGGSPVTADMLLWHLNRPVLTAAGYAALVGGVGRAAQYVAQAWRPGAQVRGLSRAWCEMVEVTA